MRFASALPCVVALRVPTIAMQRVSRAGSCPTQNKLVGASGISFKSAGYASLLMEIDKNFLSMLGVLYTSMGKLTSGKVE